MAVTYTRDQLKLLISNASRLGFWDDVVHFEKILSDMNEQGL